MRWMVLVVLLMGCGSSNGSSDAGFGDGDPGTDRAEDGGDPGTDRAGDGGYEKIAWGWVEVLEVEGVYIGGGSVRAYFAVEPSYPRSLTHHLDVPCQQTQSAGSCSLWIHPALLMSMCDPPCNGDQECMYAGTDAYCQDLPAHWDVGTVTVEGLKTDVAMTPDDLDCYADSRVRVLLLSGPHDPTRPTAGILCDVPDSDGSVEIGAALVDGFINNHVVVQKFSRITRYTRDVRMPFGKDIELIVGSVRELGLILP